MNDRPSPAEQWTPEQRGRALHFIIVLANTPPDGWRSKPEIYEALAEFRTPQDIPTDDVSSTPVPSDQCGGENG